MGNYDYDLLSAVPSDPAKRLEYDASGAYEIDGYTLRVRITSNNDNMDN